LQEWLVMRCRGTLLLLVCALVLALPASALAQSAGDNQYTDPFQGQSQGGGKSGGGGNSGANTGNSGTSNQTAQAPTASAAPSASAGQSQSSSSQAAQLPRTGFSLVLPLAYGFVLLLGGIALRRGARPRIQ
jgi:hypothetical protein